MKRYANASYSINLGQVSLSLLALVFVAGCSKPSAPKGPQGVQKPEAPTRAEANTNPPSAPPSPEGIEEQSPVQEEQESFAVDPVDSTSESSEATTDAGQFPTVESVDLTNDDYVATLEQQDPQGSTEDDASKDSASPNSGFNIHYIPMKVSKFLDLPDVKEEAQQKSAPQTKQEEFAKIKVMISNQFSEEHAQLLLAALRFLTEKVWNEEGLACTKSKIESDQVEFSKVLAAQSPLFGWTVWKTNNPASGQASIQILTSEESKTDFVPQGVTLVLNPLEIEELVQLAGVASVSPDTASILIAEALSILMAEKSWTNVTEEAELAIIADAYLSCVQEKTTAEESKLNPPVNSPAPTTAPSSTDDIVVQEEKKPVEASVGVIASDVGKVLDAAVAAETDAAQSGPSWGEQIKAYADHARHKWNEFVEAADRFRDEQQQEISDLLEKLRN